MKVVLKSIITNKLNSMELDVTGEQMHEFLNVPKSIRRSVQQIFPNLTPTEREFLLTGMNEEEQKIYEEMWDEFVDL